MNTRTKRIIGVAAGIVVVAIVVVLMGTQTGLFGTASTTPPAQISLNRTVLNYGATTVGEATGDQDFLIDNSGKGALNWTVSTDQDWISATPSSGSGSGQVTVSVKDSGLSEGTYMGTITISAPDASNSPQTVNVNLDIYSSTSRAFGAFDTPVDNAPPAKHGNCICEKGENENEHNAPTDCTLEPIPECKVKGIEVIGEGVYPKWSYARNLIAFNRVVNANYEIFTMKPDGSDVICLTCNKQGLPEGHRGQPYWHPGGEYIVFAAENTDFERLGWGMADVPGLGRNHNVWIMTSDGSQYWQVTHYPENWGVIRPSFSHDGETLYWNEEYSMEKYPGVGCPWNLNEVRRGEEWGLWHIKLANVSFGPDGPEVSNIRNVVHSDLVLLEGFGFSPDDQRLIFTSANLTETEGTAYWGGDIYIGDPGGGSLTRLTNTRYYHDENAEYSPDGKRIVLSHACGGAPAKGVELFLMESDGSNKTRLTHFNDPGYPEYISKTYGSGEMDWSPDGTRIVFGYGYQWQFKYPFIAHRLYRLTFEGACGNLP